MNKKLKHIAVLAGWIAITVAAHLPAAEAKPGSPLFRFGAVADCQYRSKTSLIRKYNLSPQKLTECVELYNKLDLAFVVHLGDFIDRDFESFKVVSPIFASSRRRTITCWGIMIFPWWMKRRRACPLNSA